MLTKIGYSHKISYIDTLCVYKTGTACHASQYEAVPFNKTCYIKNQMEVWEP